MFCAKCGTAYNDTASFCPKCGQPNPAARAAQQNYYPPNQPYGNQGYQNQGYQNQGYQYQSYQNQGYQNQGYQNQGYQNDSPSNGMSVAALVCGILGIIGAFIPIVCYFTLVLAILGIVFAAKGLKMVKMVGAKGKGLATAGLVCGIVGASFSGIGVICALACAGSFSMLGGDLFDAIEDVFDVF